MGPSNTVVVGNIAVIIVLVAFSVELYIDPTASVFVLLMTAVNVLMMCALALLIFDAVLDLLRTLGMTDKRGPFTRFSDWLFDKMFSRFRRNP